MRVAAQVRVYSVMSDGKEHLMTHEAVAVDDVSYGQLYPVINLNGAHVAPAGHGMGGFSGKTRIVIEVPDMRPGPTPFEAFLDQEIGL